MFNVQFDPRYFRSHFLPILDNSWDFGSSAKKPRDIYLGRYLIAPATNGASRLLLGAATLDSDISSAIGNAQIVSISANQSAANHIIIGTNPYASGPHILAGKTRSTLGDANTIVLDGDELFAIYAYGADGAAYAQGAVLQCKVDGTPGTNSMGSSWVFNTSPVGSASPTEKLRIKPNGDVLLATSCRIGPNTSDGSDNLSLLLGHSASSRGGYIGIGGNEEGSYHGGIDIVCGNSTGGQLLLSTTHSSSAIRLNTAGADRFTLSSAGDFTQDGVNGGNISLTKQQTGLQQPVQTGIGAAGSTISDATALTGCECQITTVSAGQGCKLWAAPTGTSVFVYNGGATGVKIYPDSGSVSINANGNSVPVTVASGYCAIFKKMSSTKWQAIYAIQAS